MSTSDKALLAIIAVLIVSCLYLVLREPCPDGYETSCRDLPRMRLKPVFVGKFFVFVPLHDRACTCEPL